MAKGKRRWILSGMAGVVVLAACIGFMVSGRNPSVPRNEPADSGPASPSPDRVETVRVAATATEASHGFGLVKAGSKHSVTFLIDSSSASDVSVRRIRSECDCMTVSRPPKCLAAGATTAVQVDLEVPSDTQHYSQRILLQTSDPARPLIALQIQADIGLPLIARTVRPDTEGGDVRIVLTNRGDREIRPVYATSSMPEVVARVPRATVPAGGDLAIPLTGPDSALTAARCIKISIFTDCPTQPRVDVEINPASQAAKAESPSDGEPPA
jgi:uncharacterized protein DUF1573